MNQALLSMILHREMILYLPEKKSDHLQMQLIAKELLVRVNHWYHSQALHRHSIASMLQTYTVLLVRAYLREMLRIPEKRVFGRIYLYVSYKEIKKCPID